MDKVFLEARNAFSSKFFENSWHTAVIFVYMGGVNHSYQKEHDEFQ